MTTDLVMNKDQFIGYMDISRRRFPNGPSLFIVFYFIITV